MTAFDAGVAAIVAVVDAGAAVAGAAATNGTPAWVPWWVTVLLGSGVLVAVGGLVTAIVSVVLQNRNTQNLEGQRAHDARALENVKSELAITVSEGTEHLKAELARGLAEGTERLRHGLADDLAKRTRRAEYVRGQIDHLYGPLAFFFESSARHVESHVNIHKAANEYFSPVPGRQPASGEQWAAQLAREADQTVEIQNRYAALVEKNNEEVVKVLREGWGWLDADDVEAFGQLLTDVSRRTVEFEGGRKLPVALYIRIGKKEALEAPIVYRPAVVARVRAKLLEKQRELAGLTGASSVASSVLPSS